MRPFTFFAESRGIFLISRILFFELMQAYLRVAEIDYGDEAPPIDVQAILELLRSRLENPGA